MAQDYRHSTVYVGVQYEGSGLKIYMYMYFHIFCRPTSYQACLILTELWFNEHQITAKALPLHLGCKKKKGTPNAPVIDLAMSGYLLIA